MILEDNIISQFRKIPYATVYNFQPWTLRNAKTLKESLQWPSKIIKRLVGQKFLTSMKVYPRYEKMRTYRYNTFYSLSGGEIARSMIEHESGLVDIFLAFLYLYPDYEIEIDTTMKFTYKLDRKIKRYQPDAVIRLTSPQMKKYDFILEFERTKSNEDIYKNKFAVNNILSNLNGLSKNTKFLYVYTYEKYNVFWRPLEYEDDYVKEFLSATHNRLIDLIKNCDCLDDRYRFLAFPFFHILNKPMWFNNKLETVKLIN